MILLISSDFQRFSCFWMILKVQTWFSSFETGTYSKRLLNARAAMQKSSATDQNSRNDLHFSCAFLPKTPNLPLAHQHVTFSNFYTLWKFFHKNIKKAHADDVQRTVNVVAKQWACLPVPKSAEFSALSFSGAPKSHGVFAALRARCARQTNETRRTLPHVASTTHWMQVSCLHVAWVVFSMICAAF